MTVFLKKFSLFCLVFYQISSTLLKGLQVPNTEWSKIPIHKIFFNEMKLFSQSDNFSQDNPRFLNICEKFQKQLELQITANDPVALCSFLSKCSELFFKDTISKKDLKERRELWQSIFEKPLFLFYYNNVLDLKMRAFMAKITLIPYKYYFSPFQDHDHKLEDPFLVDFSIYDSIIFHSFLTSSIWNDICQKGFTIFPIETLLEFLVCSFSDHEKSELLFCKKSPGQHYKVSGYLCNNCVSLDIFFEQMSLETSDLENHAFENACLFWNKYVEENDNVKICLKNFYGILQKNLLSNKFLKKVESECTKQFLIFLENCCENEEFSEDASIIWLWHNFFKDEIFSTKGDILLYDFCKKFCPSKDKKHLRKLLWKNLNREQESFFLSLHRDNSLFILEESMKSTNIFTVERLLESLLNNPETLIVNDLRFLLETPCIEDMKDNERNFRENVLILFFTNSDLFSNFEDQDLEHYLSHSKDLFSQNHLILLLDLLTLFFKKKSEP